MDKRMKDIQSRLRAINDRIQVINRQRVSQELTMDNFNSIKELSDIFGDKIDDMTFEQRQHVVRLIIDKVVVRNKINYIYIKSSEFTGGRTIRG